MTTMDADAGLAVAVEEEDFTAENTQPIPAAEQAPPRAIVFPGQGSQAVGMGKELADAFPAAREVFQEVDDALEQPLSTLMFEGPGDDLTLTENAQPALMAVSMAVVRILETEGGVELPKFARYAAGHSLGEYSALTAVGSFRLADTARLLRIRGQAMQKAVPVGEGAMAALMGLDLDDVHEIANEAADGGLVCQAANENASGQVVVSGSKAAVEKAIEIASSRGSKRSVLLPVSAPFHCALMQPAAEAMAGALEAVEIAAPAIPIVSNVTAEEINSPDDIRKLLVQQVTHMVRWRESVLYMKDQGIESFVEIGSGKVLTGLTKRIDRSLTGVAVNGPADVETLLKSL